MNFDNKIKKMTGKNKCPTLDIRFNGKGASIKMQNLWKGMNKVQRTVARKYLKDSDNDRVPDIFDCQPFNTMRQDSLTYSRSEYNAAQLKIQELKRRKEEIGSELRILNNIQNRNANKIIELRNELNSINRSQRQLENYVNTMPRK